jgi:hypothetical protein
MQLVKDMEKMLQHNQEPHAHASLDVPVTRESPLDQRIEVYLDSLCTPLESELEKPNSRQARTEMRIHIESLFEANIELGDSREQAIEHALKQFGNTHTIQREWKRTSSTAPNFKTALFTALRLNAAASFAVGVARPVSLRYGSVSVIGWQLMANLVPLVLYVLPVTTGLTIGLFAKRRPMFAVLCSLLLLLLPMTVLNANLSQLIVPYIYPNGATREWATVFLVFWIPFGCAGAGVGSLIRRLMQRRKQPVIAA